MDKKIARYINSVAENLPDSLQHYLKSSNIITDGEGKKYVNKTTELRLVNHSKRIKRLYLSIIKRTKYKSLDQKFKLIDVIGFHYFLKIRVMHERYLASQNKEENQNLSAVDENNIEKDVIKDLKSVDLPESTEKILKKVRKKGLESLENKDEIVIETGKEGAKEFNEAIKEDLTNYLVEDLTNYLVEDLKQESKRGRKRKIDQT